MTSQLRLEIKGLIEAQRKADQVLRDLRGAPFVQAMRDATMVVLRDARRYAPVDTGRLRASIVPDVRRIGDDVVGIVGTNVDYAPYMELGTRPHFPPVSALMVWARRHHINAFLVARAISRRGLKARPFLSRSLMENSERVFALIGKAVGRIVEA